jgi:IS605 OrfB family transposase
MTNRQRTYQTRMDVVPEQDILLSQYASVYSQAERTLFAKLQAGDKTNLKHSFQQRFGLTARQFNALHAELTGKVAAVRAMQQSRGEDLKQRIAKAKRVIKKTSDPFVRHQKKRRLAMLQDKLKRIQTDKEHHKIRLCFGSKKLFRAQFDRESNGYASHAAWLNDWQAVRKRQFFVIGSKDETAGCQSCVATVTEDGRITLRLRLPNAMSEKYSIINNLRFPYGQEEILAAIGSNLSDNKNDRQAIHYRFVKDDTGWRVFVTIRLPEVHMISDRRLGVIGVDINADHLAITETDRYGNPVEYCSIPCRTYGKTTEQRKAVIGNAVKEVIEFARARSKPLVIERLDFQHKKAVLERQAPGYARMLSALAYTQLQTIIRARACDAGIETCEVLPAYTSVIGRYKFADRYGLSAHHAAALVIGRRSLGLRESLPGQLHATLPLSVRNRGRHVWSQWAVVSRQARAALAAHRQSLTGSSPPPVSDKARRATLPPVPGGSPGCESSRALFA